MGKTTTPLTILIHPSLQGLVDLEALRAKGHRVDWLGGTTSSFLSGGLVSPVEADLLLGPTCWRIVPELVGYVDDAIKAAQKVAKASKPKEKRHA